jgi:hypothetical protein
VPVPYFLLFLCFRKVTQEIFSELDETKAKHPEIGRVQKLFPAPCRRGESPPEVFFIAMLASGAISE